jgi:hypothetical protein
MKTNPIKKYPTIACCGIDCGLCPRYYTEGTSKCPGCCGKNFLDKHPSCSIITCCVKHRQFETCAECPDFPCLKLKNWDRADSFVTHQNALINLRDIREHGLPAFIKRQNTRIDLLKRILKQYDDGRSKSFFCLASALLPIDDMKNAIKELDQHGNTRADKKSLAKLLKDIFRQKAALHGIELAYRN